MINIVPCEAGQLDILADIAVKTYQQNYAYLWADGGEYYLKRFYGKETLEADLRTPGTYFFLVYDACEVIGYFKLKENACSDRPGQDGIEVDKLYLLQQATGKGAGKKIMAFIFELAKNQQCAIAWLMVMESSPAKKFYEFIGFKQTGRSRLDYPGMIDEYRWIITMVADHLN